jgi:hypothetical protein
MEFEDRLSISVLRNRATLYKKIGVQIRRVFKKFNFVKERSWRFMNWSLADLTSGVFDYRSTSPVHPRLLLTGYINVSSFYV